jgi:hypothetical protein
MKIFAMAILLGAMAACSHNARKVDCDKHLEAINPPAAVKTAQPANL